MRTITDIIIHCSASPFGNVETIRRWHVDEQGWSDIGYHYVILNCYPTSESWTQEKPNPLTDGKLETGRPEDVVGAHVEGHNQNSIGICLIGGRLSGGFTGRQLERLKELVRALRERYPDAKVSGHKEWNSGKTCPNLDLNWLKKYLGV